MRSANAAPWIKTTCLNPGTLRAIADGAAELCRPGRFSHFANHTLETIRCKKTQRWNRSTTNLQKGCLAATDLQMENSRLRCHNICGTAHSADDSNQLATGNGQCQVGYLENILFIGLGLFQRKRGLLCVFLALTLALAFFSLFRFRRRPIPGEGRIVHLDCKLEIWIPDLHFLERFGDEDVV